MTIRLAPEIVELVTS